MLSWLCPSVPGLVSALTYCSMEGTHIVSNHNWPWALYINPGTPRRYRVRLPQNSPSYRSSRLCPSCPSPMPALNLDNKWFCVSRVSFMCKSCGASWHPTTKLKGGVSPWTHYIFPTSKDLSWWWVHSPYFYYMWDLLQQYTVI
jgi:hypothetical protein